LTEETGRRSLRQVKTGWQNLLNIVAAGMRKNWTRTALWTVEVAGFHQRHDPSVEAATVLEAVESEMCVGTQTLKL
jgi:hypothetical protein